MGQTIPAEEGKADAMSEAQSQVAHLRTLGSIRPRCKRILERCISGKSKNFRCNLDRIVDVADRVVAAIRRDYATLQEIPFHSRWRHFEAGAVNRKDRLLASEAWKVLMFTYLLIIIIIININE